LSAAAVFTFVGGIGLFLLGMRLMTDGLKFAAGGMLRSILEAATRSRIRALGSGVLITALVQSSSAVVFATVGFVNAGLLSLYQAVGVIFGSNLGTTLTSWIVAVSGFDVDLQLVAMPAIGAGMALWVAFGARKYGAMGQAIAGLGLFFLGIDLLSDTFAGLGDGVAIGGWAGRGIPGLLLFVAVGVLLTVLMQSSSAALAVTLTAAAGGVIPLTAGAAMVIGANVGTTSTAVLAALGATAPAKRAASAHVVFNVITGVVALLLLPLLLWLVARIVTVLALDDRPAISLAVFHTLTKAVGILLLWPLTGRLVADLERRFRSMEEDESQPRFLDRNVQALPALAIDALSLELRRMSAIACRLARQAIEGKDDDVERLAAGRRTIEKLHLSVGEFASGISREGSDTPVSGRLPDALRVGQYLVNVADNSVELHRLQNETKGTMTSLTASGRELRAKALALLDLAGVELDANGIQTLERLHQEFEAEYQSYKSRVLRAGTAGEVTPRGMASMLEQISRLHRIIDQAKKAAVYLHRFARGDGPAPTIPDAA
jgi:phosphate:Na+ symporter